MNKYYLNELHANHLTSALFKNITMHVNNFYIIPFYNTTTYKMRLKCKKGSRRCGSDRKYYKKSFRKYRTTTGRKCYKKCNDNKCHKHKQLKI